VIIYVYVRLSANAHPDEISYLLEGKDVDDYDGEASVKTTTGA
jgi:hypothetical protein